MGSSQTSRYADSFISYYELNLIARILLSQQRTSIHRGVLKGIAYDLAKAIGQGSLLMLVVAQHACEMATLHHNGVLNGARFHS